MSPVPMTTVLVILRTGSLNTLSRAVEEVRLVRGVVGSDMMLYVVVMSLNDGMSLLSPELTSVTSTRSEVTAEVVGVRVERIGSAITPPEENTKQVIGHIIYIATQILALIKRLCSKINITLFAIDGHSHSTLANKAIMNDEGGDIPTQSKVTSRGDVIGSRSAGSGGGEKRLDWGDCQGQGDRGGGDTRRRTIILTLHKERKNNRPCSQW